MKNKKKVEELDLVSHSRIFTIVIVYVIGY